MTATILDGKALAQKIRSELASEVAKHIQQTGNQPMLAAVLVGNDPASEVYVRHKQRDCEKTGIGVISTFMAKGCVDVNAIIACTRWDLVLATSSRAPSTNRT